MKHFYFIFLLLSVFTTNSFAQCPASISIDSTKITTATCPSNGAFTIYATSDTGVIYQIKTGPVGFPPGAQNSPTFSSLSPGTYTVKVACQLDENVFTTTTIVVPSTYIQLADTSVTSNICTSGIPGGSINTTITAGNSAPFSYAYWQGDPAQTDGTLTYQVVNTTSTTNTFIAPTFGIYNVRVKDACGVFVTHQITVEKTFPSDLAVAYASVREYPYLTCSQLTDSVYLELYFTSNLANLPAQGVDVEVWENSSLCEPGTLIKTVHVDDSIPPSPAIPSSFVKVKRATGYTFVTKTPCGDQKSYCYDATAGYNTQDISVNVSLNAKGCKDSSTAPIPYSILLTGGINYSLPLTVEIKDHTGTPITGSPFTSDGTDEYPSLPADTYTVIVTDACGQTDTYTLNNPEASGTPENQLTATVETVIACSITEGKTTLFVNISGIMANVSAATATIITESPLQSPTLVGAVGVNNGIGRYEWKEATPGVTYTIRVDNGACGDADTVTVTIPANTTDVVEQHTTATVQQLCGGIGNIIVDSKNNGYGYYSYDIKNSAGNIVGKGTVPGGTYPNLPAGNYTLNIHMLGCGPYDSTKTITILPGNAGPVIIKKLGIICEDGSGNSTGTGSAIFSVIGAKPLKVDYRLTSGTDSSYIHLTDSSDGTETITGLAAYTSYTLRITDACGNATIEEVNIGKLNPLVSENTASPCVGSSYILSVPDMVDATYSWTKNGVSIPAGRTINFPSYSAADDGTYVCTIVIGGCVTRVVTTSLNHLLCGQNITISGKVFNDANANTLIDGTEAGTTGGTNLYVYLVDPSGIIVDSSAVNSNGTYDLTGKINSTYTIELSTVQYPIGTDTNTTPILTTPPTGWITTGENGAGNTGSGDGTPDGKLAVVTGTTDVTQQNFGIADNVPIANPDYSTTVEDTPVTIPVVINNDTFGSDGPSTGTITITDQPTNGTATVDNNGTPNDPTDDQITYTPNPDFNGEDSLIYQICDSNGDCDTALVIITILPGNDLPTANTDSTTTAVNTPVTVPVLVNDTFGPDGPSTGTITITDQPHNGVAAVDDGGTPDDPTDDTITYTPDPNFTGKDTLIYQICDGYVGGGGGANRPASVGDCDTAMVIIYINDVPTANPDYSTTLEDTPVTIPVVTSNDDFGSDGPGTTTIVITDQPNNGTAVVNDGGTPNDPTDDQITYTPNPNYNGSDTLIYQICDSNGDCDTALVVITIPAVNDIPTANPDYSTTLEDTPVTIPVVTSNDDFGGDGPSTGTITITDQPNNGTAVVNDGGTPNDPTDDQITYTPNPDYNGSDTLIYQICDSNGDCDTALVVITIPAVNDLPTANTDITITPINTPVTVADLINDTFGGDGPSTGTITITDQPKNGTAVVNDGGTSNDPTDDQITYTPNPNYTGGDTLIYQICDSNGDCDTAMLIITITPILPVKLVDFSANLKDNIVNLTWNTEQEAEVKDYEILFSTNGINFTSVGKVTAMNSGNYTYIHSSPVTGNNYYRIKTNDKNGTSSYSEVKEVSLNKNMSISVYPNPAHNIVTVSFNKPSVENQVLKLINITGQIVYEQAVSIGTQVIRLDVSKFSKNSTYILKLAGSKSVEIQKIVIE